MSIVNKPAEHPASNATPDPNGAGFEALVSKIVQLKLTELGIEPSRCSFVRSNECARMLNVTAEHLCAMRARGQGPPWSGSGKWVRYRHSDILDWLANLPRSEPKD